MKHFLDIGGNNGQTFDYLATLDRSFKDYTFWIFEPSPRHYADLLAKCKKMSGEYKINVCPFGIGGESRIAHFMEKSDLMGDSFHAKLASDHEVFTVNNGYNIYAYIMGIGDFLERYTSHKDEVVLDIDCEGSEYEIINYLCDKPSFLKRITDIWVEWHFVDPKDMVTKPEELDTVCSYFNINVIHRGEARDKNAA